MHSKSLYIHIPFCLSKCDYCDFFSIPKCGCVPDSYITAIKNEISWYGSEYGINSFRTVYIGGGTPSLMSAGQMKDLLSFLNKKMNGCLECTIEMNPETVTDEKLAVAQNYGVTRLSLGIQSLNENALKAVNRHCSVKDIENALYLIKKNWKNTLSLDVIAGLPGQSSEEFMSSLAKVLDYAPEHVSLYTLTIEDETPLAKRIDDGLLWNADLADEQWLSGKEKLLSCGFEQYEVSNFCKNGKESIHNMSYWQQKDYIGIGSGATGTVYAFGENESGFRWTNTSDVEKYIHFWASENSLICACKIPRTVEKLSLSTEEEEFFMMGFRTVAGVSSVEYERRFANLSPFYGDILLRLAPIRDKIEPHKRQNGDIFYSLSPYNLLFLNSILLKLL